MLNPLRKFASSAAYNCDASNTPTPTRPSCRNLRIHARLASIQDLLDGRSHAAFIVVQSDGPSVLLQVVRRVPHNDRMSGKGQHLDVVVIIADGHDLRPVDAAIGL